MLQALKDSVAQTAQRAALGGLGGLLMLTGVGFLTAALFLYLLTQTDPITACLMIGGGFAGIGLILLGLSRSSGGTTKKHTPQTAQAELPQSAMTPVVVAFLDGLQQGMAARHAAHPTNRG
ncbi:MAG: phage holin family protein [Pseudomonadota bacterium]